MSLIRKRKPSDSAQKTFITNSNSSGLFMGSGGKRIKGSNVKKAKQL